MNMIEKIVAWIRRGVRICATDRAIYSGLAATYGFGFVSEEKLLYVMAAALYIMLSTRH